VALILQNPHSIAAALKMRPRDVSEVRLPVGPLNHTWREVVTLAEQAGIACLPFAAGGGASRRRPRRGDSSGRSGLAQSIVKEKCGVALDSLFENAAGRNAGRGLWLALDHIQDPHNVGAIFRSAAFFGIEGVIVTRDQSAPLSAATYDVASGGLEYVPFAIVPNLASSLKQAKKYGIWVLGTSEDAAEDVAEVDRDRPWLLVLGNEESGLRRLTRDTCDGLCRLSAPGAVSSLNVSVAAGILMAFLTSRR
jgi:23S rRNA (guanosine2251-2'-O)-methyltransferase